MKLNIFWAIVMAVFTILLGLFLTSLRQAPLPTVNPAHEAAQLLLEAGELRDSAATLREAGLQGPAGELDARARELTSQAGLTRQAEPMPVHQLSEEFATQARMLRDSAYRLRNALLTQNDSLTMGQERRIARVEWTARNLKALARRLGSWGLNSNEQRMLYNSCILTYGEGDRKSVV
jgi:hypothetical protein